MEVLNKLLDYVSYETTSDETSSTCPSSALELILGRHLVEELIKYGANEAFIDENGYVYGMVEANDDNYSSIGLIAHMDASPAASDKNVRPRIIENYNGENITLENGLVIDLDRYPNVRNYKGKTVMVSDGNTLLAADDKAGIAIIMEVLDYYHKHQDIKHGMIKVCITPDEEIGRGADLFNYKYFDVDYCYTVDGGDYQSISYENFNAASAIVSFEGVSVHPGSAKDKMVNAINVAHEFHGMLDPKMRPEHTEGYEGFNHLDAIEGDVSNCKLYYILRNFDKDLLEKQKESFIEAQNVINAKYGYKVCDAQVFDAYKNMLEYFKDDRKTIDLFFNACKELNVEAKPEPIRGGTDGATISSNGILCPNLGTGGDNFHGPYEIWCKEDGEMVVTILLKMIELLNKSY